MHEKGCTIIFWESIPLEKDLDIKKELEYKKSTAVEFTPNASGSFTFSCPMNMIRGTLVVVD